MSLITRMRRQKAVYWAQTGTDRQGRPSYGSPVEIDCRWDEGTEEKSQPTVETAKDMATVYVDRDMRIGDRLMLGELTSSTNTDPYQTDAGEVRKWEKIPNLKAREFLRVAILKKGGAP